MKRLIFLLAIYCLPFISKGQNPWGFESAVNALLSFKVDTLGSNHLGALVDTENLLLLDARSEEEFMVSHLSEAERIGYSELNLDILEDVDRNRRIVVYCSVGKRSEEVAIKLVNLGFKNVYNLYGGIFDWTNRGYPVVDNQGNLVNRVHPFNELWGIWVNNYERDYGSE